MLAVLSVLFKLAGVVFLCIAALGVIRLPDPFQRMHAATKAGTLGAGLVIIGSVIAHGQLDAAVMGIFTVVFLLLTVPVAGHLLGRASYVSGARLALRGDNALDGVLRRSSQPLDERIGWAPGSATGGEAETPLIPKSMPAARPLKPRAERDYAVLPALEAIRFAVIDGHVEPVARRACALAGTTGASLSAHVLIDTRAIEATSDQAQMRKLIRERASHAIHKMKECTGEAPRDPVLNYDEGDPEQLLACQTEPGETLLIVPCEGWFHHQVEARQELTTWEPDGLLRLPVAHRGPVLFATPHALPETYRTLVVRDCGEEHVSSLAEWALLNNIWEVSRLVHVAAEGTDRAQMSEIAERFGCDYAFAASEGEDCTIPAGIEGVRAVVLAQGPRPRRTNWFGSHWRSRIARDMKGDVLIMEVAPEKN
jgi:monovalent cation/proton antiporter MnhG/PhaG subunit